MKWVPMFGSLFFLTVMFADPEFCWLGHENKRIRNILGIICVFYH